MAASGSVTEIASRYATALFELADEQKLLDAVADDVRQIESLLEQSADMTALVRSPVLKRDEQGKAIGAVLDKMGASDLTKKFIGHVARNKRLFALSAMIKAYLSALAKQRGEVSASVTTAKKLTAAQVKGLEKALNGAIEGTITLDQKIKPDLIGGMIVQVGSQMVDSSVSTQLQKLKLAMKGA